MKKRKNNYIIILVIISLILLIATLPFSLEKKEIKKVEASFIYSNITAFELGTGRLDFGAISENQIASRKLIIKNNNDKEVRVKIKSSGDISEFLTIDKNNFLIKPNSTEEVTFEIRLNRPLEMNKRYKGEIIIEIKSQKF